MVTEYFERFYRQSSVRYNSLTSNNFAKATEQAAWCNKLMTSWNEIAVLDLQSDPGQSRTVGQTVNLKAKINLGGALTPDDVTVDAYFGSIDHQGEFSNRETLKMAAASTEGPNVHVYEGQIPCDRPGRFGFTVRVTPSREKLGNPFVLGLVTWA
jgi:starch phosphorylase